MMIQFSCRCGHIFEEPISAAGGTVQCPQCRLLNDVPMLGDFQTIAPDGTYKVEPEHAGPGQDAVKELLYVFARDKVDADGNPIDLRNTDEEMSEVGVYETVDQSQRRERPRYDPETGELVKPIPLAEDDAAPVPAEVPFATPAVVYAHAPDPGGHVLLDLVQPHNVVVMLFVLLIYVLAGLTGAVTILQLYFFAPVIVVMFIGVIAHYGNVVNEIGIEEKDELPRVLGNLSLFEDIWHPSAAFGTALVLCYGPAIALLWLTSLPTVAAIALAAATVPLGTWLFPAIALTLLTSGSIANLRPDRVLGVIRQSRKRYLGMVAAFFVGSVTSAWGVVGTSLELKRTPANPAASVPGGLTSLALDFPLMLTGIFVMHYLCWQMGLYYRANHERFAWVGRMHVSEPRPPVVRRKPHYVPHRAQEDPIEVQNTDSRSPE
jgi:hypothetical protein